LSTLNPILARCVIKSFAVRNAVQIGIDGPNGNDECQRHGRGRGRGWTELFEVFRIQSVNKSEVTEPFICGTVDPPQVLQAAAAATG